jgi:hypothetical protein
MKVNFYDQPVAMPLIEKLSHRSVT